MDARVDRIGAPQSGGENSWRDRNRRRSIHWEDLPVGRRFKTIGRTITEADLVAFVNCTGMVEVLFTNTEFLRTESAIKQRVVPGALVYTFAEGLLVQATMQHTGFAFLNVSISTSKGPPSSTTPSMSNAR